MFPFIEIRLHVFHLQTHSNAGDSSSAIDCIQAMSVFRDLQCRSGVHMRVLGRDYQGESSRDFLGLWSLLIFGLLESLEA